MSGTPVGRKLGQLAQLDVAVLRGVGNRKRAALSQMGILSVLDLLTHYPRRYADRTNAVAICELVPGGVGVVSATIQRASLRRLRGRRSIVEVVVEDDTGELGVTFFNQPWRMRQLTEGREVALFGKVDQYRSALQMANPVVEVVGGREARQTRRIVPIYPQSGRAGISSIELATYIAESLRRAGEFADPLVASRRQELGLMGRTEAFRAIHEPETMVETEPAKRRLAFDELFRIQVALMMRKRAAAADARGIAHQVDAARPEGRLVDRFLGTLPFELTAAQSRVIGEIRHDLGSPEPMHRLLQGDVGVGKTVVAFATLLYAVQGGFQGAFMVPTEVLAEQHFLAARTLLAGLEVPDGRRLGGRRPIAIELLTSRTAAATRTRIFEELRQGLVDILIGTHALITEEVQFSSLGAVVIDEQHRFGVDQRAALREKGSAAGSAGHDPDLLVMTATPIPRTAAMTVYGDLDYSMLDEFPPGRAPVTTRRVGDGAGEAEAWARVRAEVAAGHQAFVVCPLISADAEGVDDDGWSLVVPDDVFGDDFFDGRLFTPVGVERQPPRAAVEEYVRLQAGELRGLRVGLLHGQLRPHDKEEVMETFRAGHLDVLVATTVVEVGVDVPAATVMVVEDADRFGIAQLHQLRGRVGRGGEASWCYLLAREVTEEADRRLTALEDSNDGFVLAETDLELRGEGTVLGARQKGRSDLKLASLRRDRDLVDLAREVAERGGGRRPDPGRKPAARRRTPSVRRRGRGGVSAAQLTGRRCGGWPGYRWAVRVIGGSARGRRLRAPRSTAVRPTADRVREAIFDVLDHLGGLEGATVADLFAGSGALGIEALSRGAAAATFVDTDRAALAAINRNLEMTGLSSAATRMVRADALAWCTSVTEPFDVVFVDPPYSFRGWPELLERLPARTAVLESAQEVQLVGDLVLHRVYRYGGTLVTVAVTSPPVSSAAGTAEPR